MKYYYIYKGQYFVRKNSPKDGLILRALRDTTVSEMSPFFYAEVVALEQKPEPQSPNAKPYYLGEKVEFIADKFTLVTDEAIFKDVFKDLEFLNKVELAVNKASDTQIGGDHYASMPIQPIEFIAKNNLDYFQGNVIKYVCRHASKNGKEDLLKAKHYIDLLIEQKYK